MHRRDVLKTLPVMAATVHAVRADTPGITVRMSEPLNLEPAFAEQKTFITPTDQFYVRNHFAMPKMDASTYRLEVTGAVETPLSLSLADLQAMKSVVKPLTLECAGNGRVYLTPATGGLQWQNGAVGTAEWKGVTLAAILEKAGAKASAVEVILVGSDRGAIGSDPKSPGVIPFDRAIPLAKANSPEALLAYEMNGEPLTAEHGFPLRAVFGGWYGMSAVKWLAKIIVTDTPYDGFWQTMHYSTFERRDGGLATLKALTAIEPKAQIARPALGETVAFGKATTIQGMAWAGDEAVAKVEVSVDGGTTWGEAKLLGEAKPHCWRQWEMSWTPGEAGLARLVARCYDAKGRSQPEKRDPDRRSYAINHLQPVQVRVTRSEP